MILQEICYCQNSYFQAVTLRSLVYHLKLWFSRKDGIETVSFIQTCTQPFFGYILMILLKIMLNKFNFQEFF